jgi:hypothetical protein
MAPEVETGAPEEEARVSGPIGEETIEAIVADLKRRTQQQEEKE